MMWLQLLFLFNLTVQMDVGFPAFTTDLGQQHFLPLAACIELPENPQISERANRNKPFQSENPNWKALETSPETALESFLIVFESDTHEEPGPQKNALRGPPPSLWNGTKIGSDVYGRYALGSPVAPNKGVYNVPYDPKHIGRPDPKWSIDTLEIKNPKSYNAAGFPSDNIKYWELWAKKHPETLSDNNLKLISGINPKTGFKQAPVSPRIDPQWIEHFPEHKGYKWKTLYQHHVNQGQYAIPVPGPTHRSSVGVWHGYPE